EKCQQVLDFLSSQALRIIGGHHGLGVEVDLFEVLGREQVKLTLCVENAQRIVGVAFGDAPNLTAIARNGSHGAELWQNPHAGLEQRFAQLSQRASSADVGKVRTGKSALAADHVAGYAAAFFEEDLAARRNIAF